MRTIAPNRAVAVAAGLLLGLAGSAVAQDDQQQQEPFCQTHEGFDDFDFWVGKWNVYDLGQDRRFAGTNTITKIERGCLIEERWESQNGGTGMSINYFNPITDEWRQVWVSGPGYAIDYTGGPDENGAMSLEGEIFYYAQDRAFPFRGTWTPNDDGTVRQYFEQYNNEEGEWQPWFDGLYVPSDSDEAAN